MKKLRRKINKIIRGKKNIKKIVKNEKIKIYIEEIN